MDSLSYVSRFVEHIFFMWTDLLNRFWIITVWVNRFFYNVFVEHIFLEVEQIFFIKIKNKNRLLMFQIKSTKPIKPSRSNRIAIGRKIDPNQYALVLIITEPIPISSITNWKKTKPIKLRTPLLSTPSSPRSILCW